jgi:hypothetical protein
MTDSQNPFGKSINTARVTHAGLSMSRGLEDKADFEPDQIGVSQDLNLQDLSIGRAVSGRGNIFTDKEANF